LQIILKGSCRLINIVINIRHFKYPFISYGFSFNSLYINYFTVLAGALAEVALRNDINKIYRKLPKSTLKLITMKKLSLTLSHFVRRASGTDDSKLSLFKKLLKLSDAQKTVAVVIAFFFFPQLVSAQNTDTSGSSGLRYCTYMSKQKAGNTAGWVLLAPGAAMMTLAGIIIVNNTGYLFPSGHVTNKEFLYLGGAMALASIPFFLSASRNKAKAYLSLKRGTIAFAERCPDNFSYLSVSLRIKF